MGGSNHIHGHFDLVLPLEVSAGLSLECVPAELVDVGVEGHLHDENVDAEHEPPVNQLVVGGVGQGLE